MKTWTWNKKKKVENSTGVITINCDQGHFAGCFKGGKPEYTGFVSKWPGTQVQRSLNTQSFCFLKNQFGPQEGQEGCFSKTDGKKDGSGRQPGAWLWNLLGSDPSEKPNHSCSQTALSAAPHLCFGETSSAPKKHCFFSFNPSFVLQLFLPNCSATHPPTKFVISTMNLASTFKVYTEEILVIVKVWKYYTDVPFLGQTELLAVR